MSCPSDVNTGFIQLSGPIQQIDLNSITVKSYPLYISFAPRTTVPSLIGNRIDETTTTDNTCTYKGKKFNLLDVQICSVMHKGYVLPGQTTTPVAELIMTYSPNSSPNDLNDLSGILICVPIYDSGTPHHDEYMSQLIDPSMSTCNYKALEPGDDYRGNDYKQLQNSSLPACVKSCCGDVNCLAYTFKSGTCYLKNGVPQLNKTGDASITSGSIDRNTPLKCDSSKKKGARGESNHAVTLETIFYEHRSDTSQTSFAYKTCFETVDRSNHMHSNSLYIVHFPHGINMAASTYRQLLLHLNGALQVYQIPPAIRGGDATLKAYSFDNNGAKVPTATSQDGISYPTQLSSCSDEFKNRFEYFTFPPRLPTSSSSKYASDKCPFYQTKQYKCMPFDQLKDLSGEYVVPGNTTLEAMLQEKKSASKNELSGNSGSGTLSTKEMVTMIEIGGGVILASIVAVVASRYIANKYG
jgi:hypothetical protein